MSATATGVQAVLVGEVLGHPNVELIFVLEESLESWPPSKRMCKKVTP